MQVINELKPNYLAEHIGAGIAAYGRGVGEGARYAEARKKYEEDRAEEEKRYRESIQHRDERELIQDVRYKEENARRQADYLRGVQDYDRALKERAAAQGFNAAQMTAAAAPKSIGGLLDPATYQRMAVLQQRVKGMSPEEGRLAFADFQKHEAANEVRGAVVRARKMLKNAASQGGDEKQLAKLYQGLQPDLAYIAPEQALKAVADTEAFVHDLYQEQAEREANQVLWQSALPDINAAYQAVQPFVRMGLKDPNEMKQAVVKFRMLEKQWGDMNPGAQQQALDELLGLMSIPKPTTPTPAEPTEDEIIFRNAVRKIADEGVDRIDKDGKLVTDSDGKPLKRKVSVAEARRLAQEQLFPAPPPTPAQRAQNGVPPGYNSQPGMQGVEEGGAGPMSGGAGTITQTRPTAPAAAQAAPAATPAAPVPPPVRPREAYLMGPNPSKGTQMPPEQMYNDVARVLLLDLPEDEAQAQLGLDFKSLTDADWDAIMKIVDGFKR